LLWTDCRRLSLLLYQEVHHQEGRSHRPAVVLLVMSSRGQVGDK
jgi:hypothetical protein